ncbi:hypothetical protein MNB_SM-7-1471 [hydrothermal vent metagenome]|uniref:Diguanylate cyclase n=1 Tax=hydrothermal vent metagenome TaxID=652676 RepID=A0A1W1B8Q3_9ZZZZ
MKFPKVGDIATREVVSVSRSDTLSYAVELMTKSNHRNIVVKEGKEFFVLGVFDVINFKNFYDDLDIPLSSLHLSKLPTISKEKNILEAFDEIKSSDFLCVIDEKGEFYGLITHSDITASMDPNILMESYQLEEFLTIGKKVETAFEDAITIDVFRDMSRYSYDNVIIVDKNRKPIGILTTKNIISLIKLDKDLSRPIKEYMITPVETISYKSTIKETLTYIQTKHFKRAVIVDEKERFVGVISQSELIALTYSNWVSFMHQHQEELYEINTLLHHKTKEYEKLAKTDALTGLYNRYKFSELFLHEYNLMLQKESKISLLMLDIDHFKKINDTYGHEIGDRVLVEISNTILQTLRNSDTVARWGGEEFVILLPNADIEVAKKVANNIRTAIEKREISIAKRVTVSIGVTEVKKGDTLEKALNRADSALYDAKKSGRNCVKISNEEAL